MSYSLSIEDNNEHIKEHFNTLFLEFNYELKSMNYTEIIYGNRYSELIFIYDGQQYERMNFTNLHYKNVKNESQFDIKTIFKHLFKMDVSLLLNDFHKKMITQENAYAILIEGNMKSLIKNNDFSWEDDLKHSN